MHINCTNSLDIGQVQIKSNSKIKINCWLFFEFVHWVNKLLSNYELDNSCIPINLKTRYTLVHFYSIILWFAFWNLLCSQYHTGLERIHFWFFLNQLQHHLPPIASHIASASKMLLCASAELASYIFPRAFLMRVIWMNRWCLVFCCKIMKWFSQLAHCCMQETIFQECTDLLSGVDQHCWPDQLQNSSWSL